MGRRTWGDAGRGALDAARSRSSFARHLLPSLALAGTRLNVLEALRCGMMTMGDFGTPYEGWADIFVEYGVRAPTPTINALACGGLAGLYIGELYPLD